MKHLFSLIFFAVASFAQADESIIVSDGNGHMSAIYHSKEYDLRLEDSRLLKATNGGRKVKIGRKDYNCGVKRFGHSWGDSEMGLNCHGRLRSDNVYIRIYSLANRSKTKISGFLLVGPNEDQVQVESNWMENGRRRKNDPEVSLIKFDLVRHSGWLK